MSKTTLASILLACVASAGTPPNFSPSSSSDLTVAFGNILAVDGVDIPKACPFSLLIIYIASIAHDSLVTQSAPVIGTAQKL